MTFEEAIGRIFDFKGKRFYVVSQLNGVRVRVVDLNTHTEVLIFRDYFVDSVPKEWKEIIPR